MRKPDDLLDFCVCCFATDEGGPYGEGTITIGENSACYSCGNSGPSLKIPRWAVDSIRKNGSWVCKRYYPSDEDIEENEMIKRLLATIKEFPGRSAKPSSEPGLWWVEQATKGNTKKMVIVTAGSAEEAMAAAATKLPYYPKE